MGLAFETISCSLKGGQRGMWGSRVKERPPNSQVLAKTAAPGSHASCLLVISLPVALFLGPLGFFCH